MRSPERLPERVAAYAERHGLWVAGGRVVAGVSGGRDSMVLLDVLATLGLEVVAAHVNYGLRGPASDADEAFVRAHCEAVGVPCRVLREAPEGSVQQAARAVRYRFFGEVAEAEGAAAVAVAHHADDQAETVLLHLLRGTGPAGLAGMPPARPLAPARPVRLVRPLLGATRDELAAYASARGIPWREDASNAHPAYLRNRVRHEVVPLLEALAPGAAARIAGLADRIRGLDPAPRGIQPHPRGAAVPLPAAVGPGGRRVLAEALRRHFPDAPRSAALVAAAAALVDAQVGRRVEAGGVRVWRERERLVLECAEPPPAFCLPAGVGETTTPLGTLTVERLPRPGEVRSGGRTAWLPASLEGLTVRPWRAGDVLRPLGMAGRKRVSDVLTERRVPPSERSRQVVLCAGGDVVWVVGHRLGAAARLHGGDPDALRVTWQPGGA